MKVGNMQVGFSGGVKLNRSESVRHQQSPKDTMQRYHGEIRRLVDAAGIACDENRNHPMACPLGKECPFKDWHRCKVEEMRELVGEKE